MIDVAFPRVARASVFKHVTLIAAVLVILFPMYWVVNTSFKPEYEIFNVSPTFVPQEPTLANYRDLFARRDVGSFLGNSAIAVGGSVVASMVLGSLAAYSLARFRLFGGHENNIAFLILSTRMVPAIVVVVPIFLMIRNFGLLNSHLGLVVVYTASNLPFVIWMMRSFFAEIPVDLEEAALVDGDSRLNAFRKIVLPLAAPGLAATAIFAVITTYNEFLFALILTSTSGAMTLPVGASTLSGKNVVATGDMAAIATIAVIPILIFALTVQRHLARGLTMGAVK